MSWTTRHDGVVPRTDTALREIGAPPDRVFAALVDPDLAGTMTMTWEVTATDDGTRMDIRAEQVPAGISAQDHAAGLASSLANLAEYVEQDGASRPE